MNIVTINPATGQEIKSYEAISMETAEEVLAQVHGAYERWRTKPLNERAQVLKKIAAYLKANNEVLARLITEEMGKPLQQARGEVNKCARVCEYYAKEGRTFLQDQRVKTEAHRSFVTFQPLGVVLAIMPWNFPFWQVFRFGIPALLAGNGILLKHAANVCGCALAIEAVMVKAGLPKNLLRALLVTHEDADRIVDALIRDPFVKAVTLTGSTRAGRTVAEKAGRALKKVVLELGGSDPYLIFKDADLKKAVPLCVASRLGNAGQSCIAAKRFIVHASIKKRFEQELVKDFSAKKLGDPFASTTDLGPLARMDLRDTIHRQVKESVAKGARLLLGGEVPSGPGAFYPPTILSDVEKGMPAYHEELFGPVATIISAANEKEAIRIANDTSYGLGAGIFSRNIKKAQKIAREELQAGACFINSFVQSDPRLPFGGVKDSGYGRELGEFGIHEFVNIKAVSVA